MSKLKYKILDQFNLKKEAEELGVKIWLTPSFLFVVMGIVIIFAMTIIYMTSKHYDSPEILVISESVVVIILFTIGNFIIKIIEESARANKIKAEFISVASHQLKTPVAEMKWESEMLSSRFSTGLNGKQKELVKSISRSVEKISRLVNDLLDVARIDQGKLPLSKSKISLKKTIEEALEFQKSFAEAAKIEIKKNFQKESFDVIADYRRIFVVIDNLISNAIKYSNKGGPVEIILRKKDGMAEFCIRDRGAGIPESEQHRISEKFFRSNNSIKDRTDGTGLGLYISKNIIEQSGGSLWFKSIENVGSEFYFTLPMSDKIK